ncbi:putative dispersed gene family protein 1 (DGF-1) [Trypanosoma cruzi]|nr:putative dispersed gene family protein 1 (DGF-1) [Trypanosoma cruzi]
MSTATLCPCVPFLASLLTVLLKCPYCLSFFLLEALMFRDDDCLCSPLRWQEIDWTPCPGLLSTLGGEQMMCAMPYCGCMAPLGTTCCGAYFQSVGAEVSKGLWWTWMRLVPLVAAVGVLCALLFAVRCG